MTRPSREAVARWNLAYAEQVSALFLASISDEPAALFRLAVGYSTVAQAWRVLGGDLAVPVWARHACAVAAEEFDRRARLEHSRAGTGGGP